MGDNAFLRILRFILTCLTLFVSLLSIGTLISSYRGGFLEVFAFYGLFQPLMILLNLLLFIFWIIRLRIIAFFPLLALFLNISFIGAVYQFPFRKKNVERETDTKITLATYNVHGFYYGQRPLTVSMVSDFMKEKEVDVLCLQEMDFDSTYTVDSIRKAFHYLPYHSEALSEKIGFHLMVLSKYPILQSNRYRFGNEGNQAMQADLLVKGDTVRLFNFHLQTTNFNQTKFKFIPGNWIWTPSEEAAKTETVYNVVQNNFRKRTEQAAFIRKKILASKYPTLVCGDMNAIPSSYTYNQVKSNLMDGFKICGSGYEYTLLGLYRLYRIDYIFHSRDFAGYNYKSYPLDFSDHKTVIMNLGLKK
jgi:endonuclease/exonuclease/phosphatase family metal-dependent hydrolase